MTWFHFCSANHTKSGKSMLLDIADWLEAGLLDLGHKVTFSDSEVENSAINVFWECFLPGMAEKIAKTGIVYGIIATEIPDGYAFNWQREPHWKTRFDSFQEVASRGSFIWTMVESTLPHYSQYCPVAHLELGFSERLISDYIDRKPENDFCFFGQRTPYREKAVEKLRRYAKVDWPEMLPSRDEVGELIGNSKIGLSFKQSEAWPIPSPTRLGRLMMAKRGAAAEFVPISTRQGEIAGLCPESSNFSEYAIGMLHSDWKHRAENVFERYRSEMPMSDIMQSILDRTIVGVAPPKPKPGLTGQWTEAEFEKRISLKDIMPDDGFEEPHLVEEGYKGFNIVVYSGFYFGVPQSFGTFYASAVGTEAYNRFPSALSHEAVRHHIDVMLPLSTAPENTRGSDKRLSGADSKSPMLIEEGYGGFNVVEYSGVYYGVPQSHGPFYAREIGTETYTRFPCGSNPEAVRHKIDVALRLKPNQLFGAVRLVKWAWHRVVWLSDKAKSIVRRHWLP